MYQMPDVSDISLIAAGYQVMLTCDLPGERAWVWRDTILKLLAIRCTQADT
jgi:hypothetical protein